MSSGDPLLDVCDLHAGYGSRQAVDGISLQVDAAETVALIGRNGAGKTTSLLAMLDEPTSGLAPIVIVRGTKEVPSPARTA
jgi:ABC-type branched-subunit amino acid transport system ATPase component